MTDKIDYDLTCWYINLRRVMELVGNSGFIEYLHSVKSIAEVSDMYTRLSLLTAGKDAIVKWIALTNPETLGQLILTENIRVGKIFTYYSNFYCKGLSEYQKGKIKNHENVILPEIYSKLDNLLPNTRLIVKYHPEHLTSNSAHIFLSGKKQIFVLGIIDTINDGIISAIPYIITTLLPDYDKASLIGMQWINKLEIHVDSIDSFSSVRIEPPPRTNDLSLLKDVSEDKIKHAFAEIIGEPIIQKDWAGEKSDLFSSYVILNGKRISTAFLFKGPSKFKPMTLAECGKNGDQINRLFSEPADLLILQHCHVITQGVRTAMRAYAQRMGDLRLFTLINGYDTIRILRAYGKCGFSPTVI